MSEKKRTAQVARKGAKVHQPRSAKAQAALAADTSKALVAVTFDLEMSRHYPTHGAKHWDFEKGNLNEPTKQYTLEACRRVKAHGGVLHSFVLGRTFEQESVDWLKEMVRQGHPIGNHTYDHVKLTARRPETVQFRFSRAPWLIRGRTPLEAIVENIQMTEIAMQHRLGVKPVGFRTPYGFADGLERRPDVQTLLLEQGFTWLSSKYKEPKGLSRTRPAAADFAALARCQKNHQPMIYSSGLVEIPVAPLTDVMAFRSRKWKLDDFLKMIEKNLRWVFKHRAVYDFVVHPSCMYVEDPEFRAVDLICDLVEEAAGRAAIVGLETIARRARILAPAKTAG